MAFATTHHSYYTDSYRSLYISPAVPLGSIQELPAESCAEIKASEGYKVADSKHWIYSDENGGQAIQATCQGQY